MQTFRNVVAALAMLVAGLSGAPAWAQEGKTSRIVVPFPPGGTADVIARLVGQQAGQASGQRFIVENRPGAGTIIGTDAVARAAPDGGTLLIMSNSFLINGILRANLPYNPATSFEPVCMLVDSPQVLVVNESAPYRSLGDLAQAAKARPGELSLGTVGPATTQHIAGEMLKRAAGIDLIYAPFTGGAPAVNAILGGHVTSVLANYNEVMENVNSGKLRPLVVTARQRIPALPNVPTMIESGYPDFEVSAFFGIVVPAKTPADTVAQLASVLKAATEAPEVSSKLAGQGLDVAIACGAEFRAYLARQQEKYARGIREANIKAE